MEVSVYHQSQSAYVDENGVTHILDDKKPSDEKTTESD